MIIETYQFTIEDNRAYLIKEGGHIVLVDAPSIELVNIIRKSGCILDYIFLTHEHCDHLWGLNEIRKMLNPKVVSSSAASLAIGDSRKNRACVHHIYITMRYGLEASKDCTPDKDMICERADIEFEGKFDIEWFGHKSTFTSTPGHSLGIALLDIDGLYLFPGDTMIKGQSVFTKFEGGSLTAYKEKTLPILKELSPNMIVYPGHGDSFRLKEYKLDV